MGFGLVYGGFEAVYWKSLARVVSSWVVSPFLGAVVSFLVYKCIRTVRGKLVLLYLSLGRQLSNFPCSSLEIASSESVDAAWKFRSELRQQTL